MKKRLVLVLIAVPFLAAVAVVAYFMTQSARMPRYQGKTAEQWLGLIFTTNQPQALEAFRKMRPETLPFVMRELQSKETKWDRYYLRKYPTLPPWLKKHLSQPVPKSVVWDQARLVFSYEPDARRMLAVLAQLLADPKVQIHQQISGMIYNMAGPGDEELVPALARCLKDPDSEVRWAVAQTLGKFGAGAKPAVPELVAGLNDPVPTARMHIAAALWKIDRQTNACAQAMRDGLKAQPPGLMRVWGIVSLHEMTPDDASLIPLLIEVLRNPDDFYRVRAAEALATYGPASREAIPVLVDRLHDGSPELRKAAMKALKSIDPDEAAKYEASKSGRAEDRR